MTCPPACTAYRYNIDATVFCVHTDGENLATRWGSMWLMAVAGLHGMSVFDIHSLLHHGRPVLFDTSTCSLSHLAHRTQGKLYNWRRNQLMFCLISGDETIDLAYTRAVYIGDQRSSSTYIYILSVDGPPQRFRGQVISGWVDNPRLLAICHSTI